MPEAEQVRPGDVCRWSGDLCIVLPSSPAETDAVPVVFLEDGVRLWRMPEHLQVLFNLNDIVAQKEEADGA